jgi:hypothetical protein
MQTRIVEAVGLAHRPGYESVRGHLNRTIKRAFFWLLLRSRLPLASTALRGLLGLHGLFFGRRRALIFGASIGDTTENDMLKLVFNATNWSLIADNTGTTPLANIFVSLHTADPGETGTQSTSEISYTGYARIAVARTTGGWTASSAGSTSPVANIDFGQMTAGAGGTVTHFATGTLTSGAGVILFSGTVTPNIVVSNGVIPRLTTASTITLT